MWRVLVADTIKFMKKTIYELPVPATALFNIPEFQVPIPGKCVLICEYESETDENMKVVLTMTFGRVEAFKCTYYMACSFEMYDAYAKVVDYGNTEWLEEVKTNMSEADLDTQSLSHLAIYFDDGPACEFICEEFRAETELKSYSL